MENIKIILNSGLRTFIAYSCFQIKGRRKAALNECDKAQDYRTSIGKDLDPSNSPAGLNILPKGEKKKAQKNDRKL